MSTLEASSVNIRRLVRSDIDAVLVLDRRIGKAHRGVNYRDMVASDPGGTLDLSFVAEAEGRVIGSILARLIYLGVPFSEVCLIHGMLVDPDYQHRGIGSRLIHALFDHCYAEDISPIRILLGERDTRLNQFFERFGFRRSTIVNYDKTTES